VRRILLLAAVLAFPAAASAGPLGLTDCRAVEGVYRCDGLVQTWDGVPLDVTVTLPREGAARLPLVANLHGFGNSKFEYLNPADPAYTDTAYAWARDGYAVLTYTSRGLWGSCGSPDARLANPIACASGYLHLADIRYEGRDTQELIGQLVDEGTADPRRIGVTGDSYGGGQTLMLAALRDRIMLPDGTLAPWRSPAGTPLRLAAAAPVIPWSDLVYAAAPNGRVSATGVTPRAAATVPVGVEKATFVNAIFAAAQFATGPGQPVGEPFVPGRPIGFLAPPGLDPEADVTAWVTRTTAGEPYEDAGARSIVDLLARYHSAYYVPVGGGPPPLMIASGFTDDLFPVDEALRFANRTRKRFPRRPQALLFGDFGHQRASNKPNERARLLRAIHGWFDVHLRGRGRAPRQRTTAFLQTCPRAERAPKPFRAHTFAQLAPRRRARRAPATQTITAGSGDSSVGVKLDPVTGGGDACVTVDAERAPGTAVAERTVSRDRVMIGAAEIEASLRITGAAPTVAQIAGRLWDVAPDGTQQLVARGTFRPADQGAARWFLHPAARRFAAGHTIKLELLGADVPYARPSNGSFAIEVAKLHVRLPIRP
jgi:hypothetical protein